MSSSANAMLAEASGNSDETRLLIQDNGDGEEEDSMGHDTEPAADASPQRTAPPSSRRSSAVAAPPPSSRSRRSSAPSDFVFIKVVARIALQVMRKFWAFTSAALLALILFYWLWGGLIAFVLVVLGATGILYHAGDRLLYHPEQPPTSRVYVPSPSMVGLTFESVFVKGRDSTRVHMFLVKQQPPERASRAPTLLFLHGNAGNIGHRLLNAKGLVQAVGCNVCLLEYRGYGHSDGSPSEEGMYMDAQAGLDHLSQRSDIDPNKILVFGRSLGGAVAIEIASRCENREKISGLIVENTFTSIPDIAQTLFSFRMVRMIPTWFYKNQFKSRWKVCRICVPVLFLSGTADQLIPSKMMTDLYNACGAEYKSLARFPNGTHNETWTCPHYYHTMLYFMEEVAKVTSPANGVPTSPPPVLVNETAPI